MKTFMFLILLAFGESANLPSGFVKCRRQEPNLNGCLLEAIKTSLPLLAKPYDEVNLPSLDPLFVPDLAVNGTINFTEPFTNGKVFGLTTAELKKFEFDFDQKTIDFSAVFPKIQVKGQHNIRGDVPVLPLFGAGTGKTTLKHLNVEAKFLFDEIEMGGKTYLRIVSGSLTMEPSSVNFKFEDLNSGDQAFADQINALFNSNWRSFYKNVEKDYVESFLKIFETLLNNFFSSVSLADAFD